MRKILDYVTHHAIAILALVCSLLALAGASYAALSIPAGSVGARELKNDSIALTKFNHKLINGAVRTWAIVGADGHLIAGGGKPRVLHTPTFPAHYQITWGVNLPHACATVVTINSNHSPVTEGPPTNLTAGYAVAAEWVHRQGAP